MSDHRKHCSTCKQHKPLAEFHRSRTSTDGYISQCEDCKNAAIRLSQFRAGKRRSSDLIRQDSSPPDPGRTHKICRVCELLKPLEDFYKESRTVDGYQARCKACQRSSAQISYAENKPRVLERQKSKYDPLKRRERALIEGYGISQDHYDLMFELQVGKCEICFSTDPKHTSGRFVVDHCHDSDQVRGLLCGECNFMIGKARDDISLLENAIEYLRRYRAAM